MSLPADRGRRPARVLVALAVTAAVGWLAAASAVALPPGGAGSDTPGTRSSVSPGRIAVGGSIRFTVTGFPAGETLYVKIDDGQGYSNQTVQGAGVVYKQKISAKGSVSGTFRLPSFVKTGKHWLRFLASQEFTDAKGNVGVKGFTNHSPSFTVVAASSGSRGSGSSGSSSSEESSTPTAGATAGAVPSTGVVTARPTATATAVSPSPAPSVQESGGSSPTPALAPDEASSGPTGSGFPLLGAGVLAGAVAVAAAGLWLGLRHRPNPSRAGTLPRD